MIHGKKVLAIIPARGGSKGLPGKNIKEINGKPLLFYTIDAAKKSLYIDHIFLSTDSVEIARIGEKYGLDVPFLRPASLATDGAATMDVIAHVIDSLNETYDIIVILQPTSPLRITADIDSGLSLLLAKNGNAVLSVVETDHPIEWTNVVPEDGCIDGFISADIRLTPRQKLPKRYRLNGAISISRTEYILQHRNYFWEKCYAYIMPKNRSVDIDDQLDFDFASFLLKNTNA